jgi:CheY-like chemotaxis protein
VTPGDGRATTEFAFARNRNTGSAMPIDAMSRRRESFAAALPVDRRSGRTFPAGPHRTGIRWMAVTASSDGVRHVPTDGFTSSDQPPSTSRAGRVHDGVTLSDPMPSAGTNGSRGALLLVDDDESIRRIARRMGERLGYEVAVAADGVEGIALFKVRPAGFSCAIVDLTMPRMDGAACCLALHEIRPEVPVVLASGFSAADVSQRFAGNGFAGFLQKPFTLAQLAAALDEATGFRPLAG